MTEEKEKIIKGYKDSVEFSEQELKEIRLAKKQFKEGKFYTQEEIEEMFDIK